MTKEITVSLEDNISVNNRGQVTVNGIIYAGVDVTNPLTAVRMKKDALLSLAIAEYLENYQEKLREERIITMMYELFLAFHDYEWSMSVFTALLDSSYSIPNQEKWRALAERAIELKEQ